MLELNPEFLETTVSAVSREEFSALLIRMRRRIKPVHVSRSVATIVKAGGR